MNAVVFDIQRFSVHDGPGIRTTVFMKGCPLRCQWCHNPEGLLSAPQLQFLADKCIGCGSCGKRDQISDAEKCPSGALTVSGKEMDEEEVLQIILRDRIFYAESGGVTFSGGECLMQADFVAAILGQVKKERLHTAVDTSGFVPWSEIEKTLDCCDLYLYDIKCMDPVVHKKYTGADNTRILENLRKLSDIGKDIWIRVPVIPGFNDRMEEMDSIADFTASLPSVRQVTLMPYHSLGRSKYETLGMTCTYENAGSVSGEAISLFEELFRSRHLNLIS